MKTLLMISAATLFGATTALAQENETFVTLDSNQNGAVSYDEAVIADPTLDRASFEEQDTDGNGSLNVAEFEAWLEGRAEAEAGVDAEVEDEPADGQPYDLTPDAEAEIDAETDIDSQSEAEIDPMEDPMDDPIEDPMTDPEVGGEADAELEAEGTLDDPMRG